MSSIYRFCLILLVVPALASAQTFSGERREAVDHFDCLINPVISGLVSCLPPEGHGVLEYQWEMGDGTVYTSDESVPYIYHTYGEPGEYRVTLTVNGVEATTTSQSVLSIPESLEGDAASGQFAGAELR